jgi:two-component system, OmpR family, sensor histidine kinase KdpD
MPDKQGDESWGRKKHFLVALSSSPNSEYLIRWTHSLVSNLNARWTALHVESGRDEPESERESLRANLDLARSLGADLISIPADDVASSIVNFARRKNVTQIIVGKSAAAGRLFFHHKSITDLIIKKSGDIDVLVLQEKRPLLFKKKGISEIVQGRSRLQYLAAAAVVAAVTALNAVFLPVIGYHAAAIIYLLAITGCGFILNRPAIIAAAALSALCWDFFFIPPRMTFTIGAFEDILMFLMYFVTAFTTGYLTSKLKTDEKLLILREEKMSLLYNFAQSLSEKQDMEEIAGSSIDYISRYFSTETRLFIKNSPGKLCRHPYSLDEADVSDDEFAAAEACFVAGAAGHAVPGERIFGFYYIPLNTPDSVVGVLGIRPVDESRWSEDQEDLLLTLARSLSLSLEREILANENRKIMITAESERLSKILLNSVSHELRTPLTTIKGSVTALMDAAAGGDPVVRRELLAETLLASDKLDYIVENLLSMSRLESGLLKLKLVCVDPEELVGLVLESLRHELEGYSVSIEKPERLSPVMIDFPLLVQALSNIVRNAVQHTPAGTRIRIAIAIRDRGFVLSVSDTGPGVPTEDLPFLFEKFYLGRRDVRTKGCGLGLSICKGIVESHGGTIRADRAPEGGLRLTLSLPDCVADEGGAEALR